jgi:hypothetical protein
MTVQFKLHRASFRVIGVRDGMIQSIRMPPGAILTSAASIDYARKRVPMIWDGRRVEIFVGELQLCATQIEVPCGGGGRRRRTACSYTTTDAGSRYFRGSQTRISGANVAQVAP